MEVFECIRRRRTIREYKKDPIPEDVLEKILQAGRWSPSSSNSQPWHFVVVKDPDVKKEIRIAAEKEEQAFYEHRAPDSWLEDLNQFGTDWHKPFLEIAPYLIVVFKKHYDLECSTQRKSYYVNESVGIASGFLLAALHRSGLATLTHTPAPMGFLEKILNRPQNEKAVLLIPVGYPTKTAEVPVITKKPFNEICTIT